MKAGGMNQAPESRNHTIVTRLMDGEDIHAIASEYNIGMPELQRILRSDERVESFLAKRTAATPEPKPAFRDYADSRDREGKHGRIIFGSLPLHQISNWLKDKNVPAPIRIIVCILLFFASPFIIIAIMALGVLLMASSLIWLPILAVVKISKNAKTPERSKHESKCLHCGGVAVKSGHYVHDSWLLECESGHKWFWDQKSGRAFETWDEWLNFRKANQ